MADISQTNRTILLEQINPEALDLLTLVGDTKGIDSLDDTAVQKINQHLLARTYEEAMDKMNPTAYSFYDAASGTVRYTLARPEGIPEHLLTVIPLRGNDVLRMLITVLDAKSASGSANIKFDYESFTQMISPKKVLDDIRQMRKELQISYSEFQALPTGDPRRDEYAAKLNSLFQSARDNYSNTMALLPLAIEDSRQRLLGAGDGNGEKHEKISAGVARFEKDGTLKILAAPTSQETALVLAENASGKELAGLLAEDYAATTQETASEYVSELVVRTFSPLANSLETPADRKKEAENYNNYLKLYTDSKAAFVKMVKPLMEKLLGIYAFFSQYPVQSKTGMRPALLIANNTPEMLAKSNNLPRLRTFLNTTNNKNEYTDSLWFAIFPNVSLDRAADVKPTRQVFAVSEENQRRDTYSINVLTQLLSALSAYQVKTFFSFETGEKTTFDRVAREGVAVFLDHSEPLTNKDFSAFAVPCLPNFTVVPQYRSGVITGETLDISGKDITVNDDPDQLARFWLEGVYIPASFVAAGITAACQCPEYLAQCFRRGVDQQLPGVRYDIEQGNNSLVTVTTLAREIAGFTAGVKEDINNQAFGFIFASENITDKNGKNVPNVTVYKARSLARDGASFEPIYQSQVTTYFQRALRQVTGDNKSENIRFFFSTDPKSQMSQWNGKKEAVNAIVQPEDSVAYEMEQGRDCNITFRFGGNTKNMRITIQHSSAG